MLEVIKHIDVTVLEGHRSVERQAELFRQGKSKLDGSPGKMSKHNHKPSLAVDVAPYPIDWQDRERFIACAFFIKGIASQMGIKLRLGADWNGDFRITESFFDAPHFELVNDD
tara:strand:+ start:354 stop:692 length:339 start_codon:yes stop_codon:yes gene_type:complete